MPMYLYTSDDGDKKSIRLASETATAGGFSQGATDDDDSVKVSKSNREFGQRPRRVRLSRNTGSEADPNIKYKTLPVATITAYGSAAYNKGATVTIDGEAWTVVSKDPENNK